MALVQTLIKVASRIINHDVPNEGTLVIVIVVDVFMVVAISTFKVPKMNAKICKVVIKNVNVTVHKMFKALHAKTLKVVCVV